MSVTIGYWSGYLGGLIAGGAVGSIITYWFSTRGLENDNEEDNVTNENNLPDLPSTPTSGPNIIYFRFTDESLANILSFVRERDILNRFASNTDTEPCAADKCATKEQDPDQDDSTTFVVKNDDDSSCSGCDDAGSMFAPFPAVATNNIDVDEDEMNGIFEEQNRVQGRSVEESLAVGRKLAARPVAFPTAAGGGYATMSQLDDIGKKNSEFKEQTISRAEELEIIHAFRGIIGCLFYDVKKGVSDEGYHLHPLYVGSGDGEYEKHPAQLYSGTTLGVKIDDPDFSGVPSVNAVIKEIVDVGGMDYKDRGRK